MRTTVRSAAIALLALTACSQRPAAGGRSTAPVALGVGRAAVAQLPGSTRLALAVTAADMAPVTVDLPLDGSTTTLEVPAGKARLFTLDAFNAAGRSHTGSTLVPELVAGTQVRVSIHLAPVAGTTSPSRWLVYHRFANPGQAGSMAAAREDGGATVTLATVADGGDVRYAGFSGGRVLFTRAEPGALASVWSVLPDGTGEVAVHQAGVTGASVLATLGDTVITSVDGTLFLARVDGTAGPVLLGSGSGARQTFRSDGRSRPPDGQAEGRFWYLASGTGRSGTWSIGPGEAAPSLVTGAFVEIAAVEATPLGRRVFLASLDGQLFVTDAGGSPAVRLATDFDGSLLRLGLPIMGVARPTPLPLVLVGDRVVYPADDGAGGKYLAAVGLDGSGHEVVSPVGAALHLLGASATQAYAARDGGGTYEPVACDVPSPGFASCARSFYTGARAGEAGGWGLIVNAASLDAAPFADGSSRRLTSFFARDLWGDGSQATSPWAVQAGDLLVHALDLGADQDLVATLPDGGGRFDLAASGWNEALVGLSGTRAIYAMDVGGQRDLASSVVDQRLGAARAQVYLTADPADERVVALDQGTVFFTRDAPGGGRDFHAVLDDGSRHVRLTDQPGVVKGFAGLVTFDGPALPARLDTLTVTCAATDLVVAGTTACSAAGTMTDGSATALAGLAWSVLQPGVLAVDAAGTVSALAPGEATLVASVDGEAWVWVRFYVAPAPPPLVAIVIAPSPAAVAPGATLQLTATGTYGDATTRDLTAQATWSSSAPGVATVSAAGLATGVTAGQTAVTASLGGLVSPAVTLTVPGGPVVPLVTLPRTGQVASFSASPSDDGGLQRGAPWPTPRFANPDGTTPAAGALVLDRLTGLLWSRDAATPGPAGCPLAGLVGIGWQPAVDHVTCLNAMAWLGFTDWRLPTIRELSSLIDRGGSPTGPLLPAGHPFQGVAAGYWSSSAVVSAASTPPETAWWLATGSGETGWSGWLGGEAVWPVRGGSTGPVDLRYPAMVLATGQRVGYAVGGADLAWATAGVAWPIPRFAAGTGAEAGCLVDAATGLMWPRDTASLPVGWSGVAWQGALDLAAGLSLCGHADWRVPNANELESLVSYDTLVGAGPWLASQGFVGVGNGNYWSSTTRPTAPASAYQLDLAITKLRSRAKTSTSPSVLPVRGGQASPPLTVTSLTVAPAAAALVVGGTLQLAAVAAYSDGTSRDVTGTVTWAGLGAAAAVDATGLVTGVAPGSAGVTAALGATTSPAAAITVAPFAGAATGVARAGGRTYVSGWWQDAGKKVPCWWLDGVRHDLAGDGVHDAQASGIAVDVASVLVSGSWKDAAGLQHAALWVDGVRTDLPARSATEGSYAAAVATAGGTVHLAGAGIAAGMSAPVTWSGTSAGGFALTVYPSDFGAAALQNATALGVAVDGGVVWATGWVNTAYWYSTPSVFTGGATIQLPPPNGDIGGYWGFPTSIKVVAGVPFVGVEQFTRAAHYVAALYVGPPATATRTQYEGDGVHDAIASGIDVAGGVSYLSGGWSDGVAAHACYWTGATRVDLPGSATLPTSANGLPWPTGGIAVDAGSVYVVGSLDNGAGGVKPVTWVDGVAGDLP